MSKDYENFRNVLVMNLCSAVNPEQIDKVLAAVDITMNDFEISRKKMEIIVSAGIPEIAKLIQDDLKREHQRAYT